MKAILAASAAVFWGSLHAHAEIVRQVQMSCSSAFSPIVSAEVMLPELADWKLRQLDEVDPDYGWIKTQCIAEAPVAIAQVGMTNTYEGKFGLLFYETSGNFLPYDCPSYWQANAVQYLGKYQNVDGWIGRVQKAGSNFEVMLRFPSAGVPDVNSLVLKSRSGERCVVIKVH